MRNFKKRTYRVPGPDPVYRSRLVSLLINKVMKDGKKTVAQKIVYKALRKVVHVLIKEQEKLTGQKEKLTEQKKKISRTEKKIDRAERIERF